MRRKDEEELDGGRVGEHVPGRERRVPDRVRTWLAGEAEEARTPQGLEGQGEDVQLDPTSNGRSSKRLSKVMKQSNFHCQRITLVQVWTMN